MTRFLVVLATLGFILLGALGVAHALTTISFDLVPVNATCLRDARGQVTVLHKEETLGVDTLHLNVRGLPADTDFAVFLTSADAFAAPPFGAVAYIGDFTTNVAGLGSLKVDAIIAEAFVSTLAGTPPPASGRTWTTWSSGSPTRHRFQHASTLWALPPSMAMEWPDRRRCPRKARQGLSSSQNKPNTAAQ